MPQRHALYFVGVCLLLAVSYGYSQQQEIHRTWTYHQQYKNYEALKDAFNKAYRRYAEDWSTFLFEELLKQKNAAKHQYQEIAWEQPADLPKHLIPPPPIPDAAISEAIIQALSFLFFFLVLADAVATWPRGRILLLFPHLWLVLIAATAAYPVDRNDLITAHAVYAAAIAGFLVLTPLLTQDTDTEKPDPIHVFFTELFATRTRPRPVRRVSGQPKEMRRLQKDENGWWYRK